MTEPVYGPSPFTEIYKNLALLHLLEEEARAHAIRRLGFPPTFPPVGPSSIGSLVAKMHYETFCRTIGIDIQPQQSDNSPTPTIEGEQNAVTTLRQLQQQEPE